MQPAAQRPAKKRLWLKLGAVAIVVVGVGVLALLGVDWRAVIHTCLEVVRQAGPWAFFSAMAVLPAFGFPLSPFTLGAGPAFGQKLGLPVVVAASCIAVGANILLSYVLARWLFRPWLEKLVVRMGYALPQIQTEDQWEVAWLVRVTPGPPFFLQSYLLGLGRVPLPIYLVASLSIGWASVSAFVIFGDALLQGHGRAALGGISLVALVVVGTHFVRKRLARKRQLTAAIAENTTP